MSESVPIDEDMFEPSEALLLGRKLQSRVRQLFFVDEYEMRDRIQGYADTKDVALWEAAHVIEQAVLQEHGYTTSDIPKQKRQFFNWGMHSDNPSDDPRPDKTVDGFWIPFEEERKRRALVERAEEKIDNHETEISSVSEAIQDGITDEVDFDGISPADKSGENNTPDSEVADVVENPDEQLDEEDITPTIGERFGIQHWGSNKGEHTYLWWPGIKYVPDKIRWAHQHDYTFGGVLRALLGVAGIVADLFVGFVALLIAIAVVVVVVAIILIVGQFVLSII
jgi:hypothetical protein